MLANRSQWPYTYDSCDVGTVANQTNNGLPVAATINGDTRANGALSYLPGQRLSRCTCAGESHPGPVHADGTYVGRAAPEIDIFEAQVRPLIQSSCSNRILILLSDYGYTIDWPSLPILSMGGRLLGI